MTKLTQFILNIYEEHLKQQVDLFETFAKYFNNDSIDIEERWQVYKKINRLLPIMDIVEFQQLIDQNILTLGLRENYIDKYQTLRLEDLVDIINDYQNGDEYNDEFPNYLSTLSIDTMKLKCMKSGYSCVEIN